MRCGRWRPRQQPPRRAWPRNESICHDGERSVSTVLPAKKGETSTARPIVLQPAGWPMPKGYANGMAAEGRIVGTGGGVGRGTDGGFSAEVLRPGRQNPFTNAA